MTNMKCIFYQICISIQESSTVVEFGHGNITNLFVYFRVAKSYVHRYEGQLSKGHGYQEFGAKVSFLVILSTLS